MQLCMLDDNNYQQLLLKNIICYECTVSYLYELREKYVNIFDNIIAIIDVNKRNQGTILLGKKSIPVLDLDYFKDVEWQQSALLITSDYFVEAFEYLAQIPEITQNNMTIFFFPNQETRYELFFRNLYSKDDLRDIIIFRSGPHMSSYVKGMDFADNARALFEHMLAECYYEKYQLIWFVKNPDEFREYQRYANVYFYPCEWSQSGNEDEREKYYDALCHARYLFFTDAYGFARNCRKDQIRVQLWHGCGFKTRVNFTPCEKRYEYSIVVSEKYAQIHQKIYGLRADQMLVTGYPKQDWLFHPVSDDKLMELGIPRNKKYIFWLPTFRSTDDKLIHLNEYDLVSEIGLPIIYRKDELLELNTLLQQNEITLVIKLHPFQKKDSVDCGKLTNIVLLDNNQLVDTGIEINQLLGWADALISDYSSAAIDFLILNRPIAFTVDDIEKYSSSRGFVFEDIHNWLPGKEILEIGDLLTFIKEIGSGEDSTEKKRNNIRKILHEFRDDNSSKRLLESLKIAQKK